MQMIFYPNDDGVCFPTLDCELFEGGILLFTSVFLAPRLSALPVMITQ